MAPVTEPPWVRQGSGVAARNGTATHTIPFGWTSTPGNELVALLFGPVTHTAAGWTERLQPVNTGELSVFTRTSAGDDSITVTHNGADYPVLWVVYEFPAGTTWVNGVSDVTFEDAFPQLTGLPTREVVVVAARGRVAVNTTATAASSVWTPPWTADADLFEPHNGVTDGAYLTVAHQINVTSATVIPSATSSYTGAFASDREHVVLAVEVPAASGVAGTLAGTLPAVTGTLSGAVSASAALTATLPEATAQLAGSVTAAGSLTGTLPIPAVSLTGTLTTAGTLAGTLPALTGLLRQGRAVVPRPAGETVTRIRAPLVTDRYGSEVRDWGNATRLDIPGCGVAPRTTDEETEQGRQGVIVGITVYAPPGTDILPSDRIEARGLVYEVIGEVADWRSPFTGWHPGIVVNLRRVEG